MSQNLDALALALTRVYQPLDLGDYADEWQGRTLQVWVNAPAMIEEATRTRDEAASILPSSRRAVSVLFELPLERVAEMDDTLVLWLFNEGNRLYSAYHAALKKKSATPSATAKSE